MSRRLRRLPVLLLPLVLVTALAGCGSDESSDAGSDGADASSPGTVEGVTITGDVGKEPEVEWEGDLSTDDVTTTVIIAGDGDEIVEGDEVSAYVWVGNGHDQKKSFSDYDNGQPETIPANADLNPVLKDAVLGQTIGSRVAVTATGADTFGPTGNTSFGIAPEDPVLLIIDLMSIYTPPSPTDVPESQMPGIVEKGGEPVGLDFSDVPEPKADGDLLRTIVTEGDGEEVTTAMTVTADYLGMTYGAKKPFDESYSKEPVPFALSSVVQGWTYGLEGVKVGSRVLLQIPPSLGYGDQKQPGIPANSTLYFVIDIISAK